MRSFFGGVLRVLGVFWGGLGAVCGVFSGGRPGFIVFVSNLAWIFRFSSLFGGGRPGFLDFLWNLVGEGLDFWIFYGI